MQTTLSEDGGHQEGIIEMKVEDTGAIHVLDGQNGSEIHEKPARPAATPSATDCVEPIMSALITASKPVTVWRPPPSVEETVPDERTCRLMARLASRCAEHIQIIRRRAYRLGHQVHRAVKIWSHNDGLAALAHRMEETHSVKITPQALGNARLIYLNYTLQEYENRFSTLSDAHLLKAQQSFSHNREKRDEVLDRAKNAGLSVAAMQGDIKRLEDSRAREVEAAERAEQGSPGRGYIFGEGADMLKRLPDRSVALLRLRVAVSKDAIRELARVTSWDGIIVLDCPSIAEFPSITNQITRSVDLPKAYPLVITSPELNRAALGLPVIDRYRLVILLSRRRRQPELECSETLGNPMTGAQAEMLIYQLIPDDGILVDIGPGSISTAAFAAKHNREYLAVAPPRKAVSPGQAVSTATGHDAEEIGTDDGVACSSDPWSEVSGDVRASVTIAGVPWCDLSCCDRTIISRVMAPSQQPDCPQCGSIQTPSEEHAHA